MSNPMYYAICATLNFIPEPLYQFLQTVDHTETIFICPNSEMWHEPLVHIFDEQNTDRSTILITTSDGKIKNVEVNPSPEKVEAFNEHTEIAEEEPPPALTRDSEPESENAESVSTDHPNIKIIESENAESESENESESESKADSESKSDNELTSKPRSKPAPPAPTNDDEDELLEAAVEAPVRKTRKSTSSKAGSEAKAPAKPSASKKQKRKSDNASDEKGTNKNSEVRVAKKRKTRDAATKANAKILSKSSKGSKSNGTTSKVAVAASASAAAAATKKSTIEMKEAKSNEVGEGKTKKKKKDPSKPIDNTKKGSKSTESSTSKVAASASSTKKKTTKEAKVNEAGGGVKKKKAVSKPKNKVGEVADASTSKTKAVKKAAGKDVAEPEAPQKVGDKVGGRKRSQSVATEDSAATGSTTKKAKSTKKKKKNEDPNMPKRPLTVYMLYCMEARPAAKKANPTAKVPQIGSILGKSWKELPEKDKMRLQAKAQKLKDQYDIDKADYEKKNPPKDDNGDGDNDNDNDNDGDTPVSEGNADATEKNSTGNASSAKKKKKKKQQKDPNAPKRPLTCYMIYSSDVRQDVMKKNPGAKVPEVGKITGQMYGKLSKERKQHYAQRAQGLKDKYDIEKAEYAKKKKIADDDASKDPQDESEWF